MAIPARPVGSLFREWRQRRRLSQLEFALKAEISARHLSFLESGRSQPSREMVLHLAEHLDVPLRERNVMLLAAGYAPVFRERPFQDPELTDARRAVERVLAGQEPYPALAVDRHWNLVAHNAVAGHLFAGVDPELMQAPVNVLRLSLHPRGVAPRLANLGQWRHHLFERLRQQIQATGDRRLQELERELQAYPVPGDPDATRLEGEVLGIAVPLRLRTDAGVLNLISTTTIFGTPVDVTLQELALETFFPADAFTAQALRRLAQAGAPGAPAQPGYEYP